MRLTVATHPNILQVSLNSRLKSMPLDSEGLRERMVQGLIQEGLLHSPSVIATMRRVPRELFLPEDLRGHAYSDMPLPTGHGQTISAPHGVKHWASHGRDHE